MSDSSVDVVVEHVEHIKHSANVGDIEGVQQAELVAVRRPGRVRRLAERGLTTVEYAIGLLAAAAVALVLLRIFNDNAFFKMLFDWVVNAFTNTAGAL